MPEITPEDGSIDRPGGSPDADQASRSRSGSEPIIARMTACPSAAACGPGSATSGARLVLVTVQEKASLSNRPPGSSTRTTTV